jgi:hypothetical protein
MRSLILSLTVVAGLIAGTVYSNFGCGAVDAAFDCHAVCDRYKTCFDANYDVGACSSRCRTASGNDANYRSKADQCQACIPAPRGPSPAASNAAPSSPERSIGRTPADSSVDNRRVVRVQIARGTIRRPGPLRHLRVAPPRRA